MEFYVCNSCHSPISRGKKPFNLTQCGHVFCSACIQQAEKRCSQCNSEGAISVPIKEPIISKVANYFVPLTESMENIQKVCLFQQTQIQITLNRFAELDDKYTKIKGEYWKLMNHMQTLTAKYSQLKSEKEKIEKKLLYMEMSKNNCQQRSMASTPRSFVHSMSDRGTIDSGYGHSVPRSINVTPGTSSTFRRNYVTSDGFRVPSLPSSTSRIITDSSNPFR